MLVQEVDSSWSKSNKDNINGEDLSLNSMCAADKSNFSIASKTSYQQQRTKSLCVFYNTSIINYARAMATAKESRKISSSGSAYKLHANSVKILQGHEKIMEAQNKWTGNGKFIVKEKSSFLVSKTILNFVVVGGDYTETTAHRRNKYVQTTTTTIPKS